MNGDFRTLRIFGRSVTCFDDVNLEFKLERGAQKILTFGDTLLKYMPRQNNYHLKDMHDTRDRNTCQNDTPFRMASHLSLMDQIWKYPVHIIQQKASIPGPQLRISVAVLEFNVVREKNKPRKF